MDQDVGTQHYTQKPKTNVYKCLKSTDTGEREYNQTLNIKGIGAKRYIQHVGIRRKTVTVNTTQR